MLNKKVVITSMPVNQFWAASFAARLGTDSSMIAITLTPMVPKRATSKALPAGVLASKIMV
jgi:hypothetical protein